MRTAPAAWLLTSSLQAADFWEESPEFRNWTMAQVQQMLYRSPWVQQAYLEPIVPAAPTTAGGGFNANTAFGGAGAAAPRGLSHAPVHVRWHSARPVREAFTRALMGPEGDKELTAEQQQWLDKRSEHYILSVSGLSQSLTEIVEIVDGLAERAFLNPKGRAPIPAVEAERVRNRGELELYFLFPRTEPIQLSDKQVEFAADLAGSQAGRGRSIPVHAKFKVRDLVYKGELTL